MTVTFIVGMKESRENIIDFNGNHFNGNQIHYPKYRIIYFNKNYEEALAITVMHFTKMLKE